jgi:hypothetical protein
MSAVSILRSAIFGLIAMVLGFSLSSTRAQATSLPGKDKAQAAPTLRWAEGEPGCTFSRDDDGKYRYGLWTAGFGIILAVDSQELEKVRRRAEHILSLELTVRYRGDGSLDVAPANFTLEFVKHYNDIHRTLDPDEMISKQNSEEEALPEETARAIRKHPEKKSEKEAARADRQQDIAEMIKFLTTRSLRPVKLDAVKPETVGWIFFSTQSKWIDELGKQEEFVLRIPAEGRVIEFPFLLPPGEGDLILRRRPE